MVRSKTARDLKTSKIFFVLLLTIFCTRRFWNINVPWYVDVVIPFLGILIILGLKKYKTAENRKIQTIAVLEMLPLLFTLLYTILLWSFKGSFPASNVVSNLFTSNLYLVLYILFGCLLYFYFGSECVELFYLSACLSYFFGSIVPLFYNFGFKESVLFLITSSDENYAINHYMEVHDLSFALGHIFLYYLLFYKGRRRASKLIIIALLLFWGLKRIELAGLLLAYLCYRFLIKKTRLGISKVIITSAGMIFSYVYVMMIHSGYLQQLAARLHINFMGRLLTYQYVTSLYSRFSVDFGGIGYGYIDEILDRLVSEDYRIDYMPIITLHSDTLRMYIGLGFIGFGLWLFYILYIKTSLLDKYFDDSSAKAYMVYLTYNMVLYLTDNTYKYPVTILAFILVLLSSTGARKADLLASNRNRIGRRRTRSIGIYRP